MAAGLPVVATDMPVFREYLAHGRDALLVRPGDVAGLADAHATPHAPTTGPRRLAGGRAAGARRTRWAASARRHLEVYRADREPAAA